ncbi:MAG: hypothetical protein Q8O46_00355, partial [bacterium]|nr:hypothetical protein [bacterium]
LLDLETYVRLLTLKERIDKQQDRITKRLEKEVTIEEPPSVSTSTAPTASSSHSAAENIESAKIQEGKGIASSPFSDDVLKHLSELVTKQIVSQFNLLPRSAVGQSGSGQDDLLPEFPEQVAQEQAVEIVPSIVKKSQLSDSFDDEKLLGLVAKGSETKAKLLLKQLQKHPNDISWTSNGVIFMDQNSLPDSNIYDIFPKLFKKMSHPERIFYLFDVVTKISTLGYAHLINKSLTAGLRRQFPIQNQDGILKNMSSSKHWFYLGP